MLNARWCGLAVAAGRLDHCTHELCSMVWQLVVFLDKYLSFSSHFIQCDTGYCLESTTVYYNRKSIQLLRGWVINYKGEQKLQSDNLAPACGSEGGANGSFVSKFVCILYVIYFPGTKYAFKEGVPFSIDGIVITFDGLLMKLYFGDIAMVWDGYTGAQVS